MTASTWRKSSRSDNAGGNCVEARLAGRPQLSDSKLAGSRPILTLDEDTFAGFLAAVKNGEFDQR